MSGLTEKLSELYADIIIHQQDALTLWMKTAKEWREERERLVELLHAVRMYEIEPIYQGKMFIAMKRCAEIEPESPDDD